MTDAVRREFGNKIGRLTKSAAYLDFCEEVYGYRMYLFNMTDKAQLDFIFRGMPLCAADTLLDLGCGCGSILNRVTEQRGCAGVGIDYLDKDAVSLTSPHASYISGDMDALAACRLQPTVTLCVDSLYFVRDLPMLLRTLRADVHNRLYLFYSQYLFEETERDAKTLRADGTTLASALRACEILYRTIDYSENERRLYEASLTALQKRRETFRAEGNLDLYEEKYKETLLGKQLYDTGRASRYLYLCE